MSAVIWILSLFLMAIAAYILSYVRFRKLIAQQTKQMIELLKAENIDNLQLGDIYSQTDADFSDLERAAMSLRKKYLRLRKQSGEERKGYETVFSGLKEGIVTVDQNLRIISFNAAFMSFFKWAPIKQQANYFLHDAIRDPQIISTFKKTFLTAKVEKDEVNMFQLFVTPLPSRNENELWSLGVFYDLSEIRKTEKIRIDFVANASHEMRTPLTVIKGYADLLKQNIENNLINLSDASSKKLLTTQLDLLKPVLKGTDQLSDLMSELLNLSKIEVVGGLLKSQINITTLMTNVMLEIESNLNLNSKVIKLDQQINFVYASEDALKQILRNLLINAIKYSGDASLIQITWEGAGNAVLLKVKDNGPGITIDHQDRIFERFYRVDKGRGREQGGFGLGLALVKHHMLNHQGSVKLVSNFNLGSEFICEFPNN